jgi:hypothetical protein
MNIKRLFSCTILVFVLTPVFSQYKLNLPSPLQLSQLGQYQLKEDEYLYDIKFDSRDKSYTLFYAKQKSLLGGAEYYVRQGSRTLGPFTSCDAGWGEYWYARDAGGNVFAGTAKQMNGPFFNPSITAIADFYPVDAQRLAFLADLDDNSFLLLNGTQQPQRFSSRPSVSIAPKTGKAAYVYWESGLHLVVDGKLWGPFNYGEAGLVSWTSDGQRCIYYYKEASGNEPWVLFYGDRLIKRARGNFSVFKLGDDTIVFLADGALYTASASGIKETISLPNMYINGFSVSEDGKSIAFSYHPSNDSNTLYVNYPRPNGRLRTYGPFKSWVSFYFQNNTTLYVSGYEAESNTPVYFLNDSKYTGDYYSQWAAGDKYAAFVADIPGGYYVLQTDTMSVRIDNTVSAAILPDGTPVYCTTDNGYRYFHVGTTRYGPFEVIQDMSTGLVRQWVLAGGGLIQMVVLSQ